MTGRIIVHIGTHKTGTTSIQKGLADNRSLLMSCGVLYPDYSSIGFNSHYAHLDMANALASRHPKFSLNSAKDFFSRVRRLSKDYDATIISAESFYRQIMSKKLPQSLASADDYWRARCKYIKVFRDIIGPAEICLVVRRQDDFAESMYQEQIKVTRYTKDFRSFVNDFWFHFDYHQQLKAWKRYFEVVRVVPFYKIKGPNIVNEFLREVNIKHPPVTAHKIHNVSIPHDGVIIKRLGNSLPFDARQINQLAYAVGSDKFRASVYQGPRSFFENVDEKLQFLSLYDKSNRELARMGEFDLDSFLDSFSSPSCLYGDTLPSAEELRLLRSLEGMLPKNSLSVFPGYLPGFRTRGERLKDIWHKVRSRS